MAENLKPIKHQCACCGGVTPPDPNHWEGRLDAYCYDCASARCDAYPGSCGKRVRPMTDPGIRIEITDLKTGESESQEIIDDYVVITAGDHYVSHIQSSPKTGTTQITIKRR